MTSRPTRPPLAAIRVLDLTNVLAGSFCGYQLALLGAEVIKGERPGDGDLARQLGADPALNRRRMGASFLAQNAGKRSVTLDLKQVAGREVRHRLLATADVLIENFRPGVMARLGLGFDDLKECHPRLIAVLMPAFASTTRPSVPTARHPRSARTPMRCSRSWATMRQRSSAS